MDHLPIPDHCKERQVAVPHLNLVTYDRQGFRGFLQRLGYNDPDLIAMLRDEDRLHMAESIVQEWLYFGTLHSLSEICQVPIDLDRFIHVDENGGRTVVSRVWPEYFAAIAAKETPFTEEQHQELENRLNYVADVLGAVTRAFPEWFRHLTPSIVLSIFILVETLYEMLRLLSNRNTRISTPYMSPSPGIYLQEQMRDNGWCLASIQGVIHGNASVAYFASLLPSFNDPQEHLNCTVDKCCKVFKPVGEVTCQHTDSRCLKGEECDDVCVDESELTGILDRGSFPAIVLDRLDNGKTQVKVVDAQAHDYVAISHVWAHGLGNPHANSMPECQLRRLSILIKEIYGGQQSPALWIDTLCVPVHSKSHRKMSISRLRLTYKQAAKVLILDRQLLQVDSSNVSEAVCHVLCSDWMSRLWTLQEGLLPDMASLYIQFQDGAVAVQSLCGDESIKAMPHIVENKLRTYLSGTFLDRDKFGTMEGGGNLSSRPYIKILALMRNLQRRRTTKPEDEAICIATLMDIDLGKFHTMPSMEDVYRTVGRLPSNLIFAPGTRLQTPGFRWAPSSFLKQPITGLRRPEGLTVLGLATERGFDFMTLSLNLRGPLTIKQTNHASFVIELADGMKDICFIPDFTDYPDLEELTVEDPAIVMGDQHHYSQAAVLVQVTENRGRIRFGNYRLPGFIVQMGRTTPAGFRHPRNETVRGEIPLHLNWVID